MSKKLKEGQKLLVQATKINALGQVSAGIVHEIGQPLTSIHGLTELLLIQDPTDKQKKRIKIIQNELMRLSQIIHKFSSFTHKTDATMTKISLNHIIDEVYLLLEHHIRLKGISFILKKADDMPRISGDKDSLKQVFINLIINSINALENKLDKNRFIRISSFIKENFIQVEVKDNGEGIPEGP